MAKNHTGRYIDGMKETLDFIKESRQIDLLNKRTVSLHILWVYRVIRLRLGAHTTGLTDTNTHRQDGEKMEMKLL